MSTLHGSSIPGALEGAPFHDDNYILTFASEANATPTLVYVGACVTLATDANFTVKVTHADSELLLGVAGTSGQLGAAIQVICRGWVQVYTDANVTAGALLYASSSHDGMVGTTSSAQSRCLALESVNGSVTPALINVLLF